MRTRPVIKDLELEASVLDNLRNGFGDQQGDHTETKTTTPCGVFHTTMAHLCAESRQVSVNLIGVTY